MARVQVALNVRDLDASIEFYTKLLRTPPAKVREHYANFAVDDPPLKLVLFAGAGEPGTLNHIGIEVESPDEVAAAIARARDNGLGQHIEGDVTCCYSAQRKTWIVGPDNSWEVYAVLADTAEMACDVCRVAHHVGVDMTSW